MPNSASAIVTAAEPIWATFPARASKSGCRAANRNPPPPREKQGAGPAGGDRNAADRAPRCERSISAQCERPTTGPRRAPAADEFRSSPRRVPAVSRSVSRRKRPVIAARLAVRLGARPPAPTP